MTHLYPPSSCSTSSKAGWINAVLIPVKQHIICCSLVPLAASLMGGGTTAALETPLAEATMFVMVPPLVTYGVMLAEQKWHAHKASCDCGNKTRQNYFRQTALSYAFYTAAYLFLPHRHHEQTPPPTIIQGKKHVLSLHY